MLKLNNYGQVNFSGNRIDTHLPKSKLVLYRSETNTDSEEAAKKILKENFFQYKHLRNTRPIMLSHTAIDSAEWLSQLDTHEERNLAIKILKNFTYIDLENARKAFRKLHKELESEIDINKTKFATLGSAKSGSMMGYLYRQANKMRSKGPNHNQYTDNTNLPKEEQFLTSTQLQDTKYNQSLIERGFENIVIVDDILGDGDSIIEYFTDDVVNSLKQYKKVYYVTLVKDPDGEKKIHEKYPFINFKCANEVKKYDSKDNEIFTDEEKSQIDKMLVKYGERIAPELVKKYSRSKLFVAFDWNTPGNTPMMFNYSTNNWNALFKRFNGLEKPEVKTNCDFYC